MSWYSNVVLDSGVTEIGETSWEVFEETDNTSGGTRNISFDISCLESFNVKLTVDLDNSGDILYTEIFIDEVSQGNVVEYDGSSGTGQLEPGYTIVGSQSFTPGPHSVRLATTFTAAITSGTYVVLTIENVVECPPTTTVAPSASTTTVAPSASTTTVAPTTEPPTTTTTIAPSASTTTTATTTTTTTTTNTTVTTEPPVEPPVDPPIGSTTLLPETTTECCYTFTPMPRFIQPSIPKQTTIPAQSVSVTTISPNPVDSLTRDIQITTPRPPPSTITTTITTTLQPIKIADRCIPSCNILGF